MVRWMMTKMILPLMAAMLGCGPGDEPQIAAVPPPATESGADCNRPEYATDRLVCADAELLAIDRETDALAIQIGQDALVGIEPTLESQSTWFRRRSMCAFDKSHRQCAIDAYTERQSVLLGLMRLDESAKTPTFLCHTEGSHRSDFEAQFVAENLLALLQRDRIVGVAMLKAQSSSWQPYLSYVASDAEVKITQGASILLSCEPLANSD